MSSPAVVTERVALLTYLRSQREHVLKILENLSEEALHKPVLPSGWSCLGMVRHLALDVERFWFQAVVAGEQVSLENGDSAWQVTGMSAETVFDLYRRETALTDRIIEDTPLNAEPKWWPNEVFADLPSRNLRQTVLHVITETACHAGHLDAAREILDGQQWLVLTE